MSERQGELTLHQIRSRWPRVTAHLIAESLGYASPDRAASIIRDALLGQDNFCAWIASCYGGNAHGALQDAIRSRHHHTGYMADYRQAVRIVQAVNAGEPDPIFGSWF